MLIKEARSLVSRSLKLGGEVDPLQKALMLLQGIPEHGSCLQ